MQFPAITSSAQRYVMVLTILEPIAAIAGVWAYLLAGFEAARFAALVLMFLPVLRGYDLPGLVYRTAPSVLVGALAAAADFLPAPTADRFVLGFLAAKSAECVLAYWSTMHWLAELLNQPGKRP